MIRFHQIAGRLIPVIECDICQRPIIGHGNVAVVLDEETGKPISGLPQFYHTDCNPIADRDHTLTPPYYGEDELNGFLFDLFMRAQDDREVR